MRAGAANCGDYIHRHSDAGVGYLICLLFGLFYGVFAGLFAIFGGHFGEHHGIESIGHTEAEISQLGHEPGAVDSGLHLTPLNPGLGRWGRI